MHIHSPECTNSHSLSCGVPCSNHTSMSLPHPVRPLSFHTTLQEVLPVNNSHLVTLLYDCRWTIIHPKLTLNSAPSLQGTPRTEEIPQLWCDVKQNMSYHPKSQPNSFNPSFSSLWHTLSLSLCKSTPSPFLHPFSFWFRHCNQIGWKCSFFHLLFPTSWESGKKEPTQRKEFQACGFISLPQPPMWLHSQSRLAMALGPPLSLSPQTHASKRDPQ